eukprot:CAMPEP_0204835368 /NCGR_PEP_ID=MMETSP1346-20131115/22418_1 /ASSEMBLY_ACC=CAM_ASM_000771 /TAXON_ID=215587 /ORGANISM="Aplanochytrium stocchinoi, Strain GSBS06" /LENGTH=102 /DNA_ID=CAMNT_0051969305 /DNA_START=68 /DNA_END=377 /DNA_ORIENTATION=-
MIQRGAQIVQFLGALADEIRTDVFEKCAFDRVSSAVIVCTNCSLGFQKSNRLRPIKLCNGFGLVGYCGNESKTVIGNGIKNGMNGAVKQPTDSAERSQSLTV